MTGKRTLSFIALAAVGLTLAQGCSSASDVASESEVDGEEQTDSATFESTSQCSGGEMCFWDDNGFADTFKALTSSRSNFNDINFGDKTSSVYNRSSVAWVLYDDAGFSDTAVCVMAGATVANLGNFGFNDKVSSALRRSVNSCPSGILPFFGAN